MSTTTEKSWRDALPPAGAPTLEIADTATDLDASLRFVERTRTALRFCPGIGWLHWDGTRWNPEEGEAGAVQLSIAAARAWTAAAATGSDDGRVERTKRALGMESLSHINAAVTLAESDPRLRVHHDALDADPWLLNVKNGTLDLHAGTLRPHHRAHLCTKLAPAVYTEGAKHPALEKLLANLEHGAPGLGDFLARCVGATLTGDASPEVVILVQGPGGNGKTTLLESLASLLGDYVCKLPFESLCASRNGRSPGGASPDLVRLRGSRLAYASEGDEAARLDAGAVKLLSGNERVTVRALYSAPMEINQTWKLWLATNFDPATDADDSGIWRRLLKLPFPALAPEHRDPAIKRELVNDPAARSALLSWALAGCLDWQARGGGREGLAPPACVLAATNAYREANNVTGQWYAELLEEEATLDPNAVTPTAELRGHYEEWCESVGASALGIKRLSAFLTDKGLVQVRGRAARGWRGIRFLPQE